MNLQKLWNGVLNLTGTGAPEPSVLGRLVAAAPRTPAPAASTPQFATAATLTQAQEPTAAVSVHSGSPAPATPGYDAGSYFDDVDRAVREGTTVEKLGRERAARENPSGNVLSAMRDTAKIEAQLADARGREAAEIALHEQHEVLVRTLERAQQDVRVLKEKLEGIQAALKDPASVETRCGLHLSDDVYSLTKLNATYGLLATLGFQAADLREGIPAFEKRVLEARAALERFENSLKGKAF